MIQDISVVICAYTERRWQELLQAIASVQHQTLPAKEIIVVIDGNRKLLQRVQENVTGIIAIENKETKGLSGARNSGVAVAQGEVVAFLDDDAVAQPDWLKELVYCYEDERVVGVGGKIKPLWESQCPRWFPEEFNWVIGCSYRGMPQTAAFVRNLIGANMSFRREVFTDVGGFRNEIGRVGNRPIGCEETELCIRAQQRWPLGLFLYIPQAGVYHRVPFARTTWQYFFARCYSEGISKAAITRYVGAQDSLSSERKYIYTTLPEGVLRNITGLVAQGDWGGLMRSFAIIVGLLMTIIGYMIKTVSP